jgi:hypothetical protein
MGSAEYTTLADAYSSAPSELDALDSWMPQQGRLLIDTIVVRTDDAYTNDEKAIIVGVIGDTHPPVTIAENTKELLAINEKQELSIPGEFEADEFYAIKNRIWQKITAGGGTAGRGIVSIILTSTVGLTDTYTITYTDATTSIFTVQNGDDGDDGAPGAPGAPGAAGRGIASIVLHATVGLTKTYRITYTDATYFDYDVKDGEDGGGGVSQFTGLTLAAANWVTDGSLYKCVLSHTSITATSIVEVIPDDDAYDVLVAAKPMAKTESAAGSVTVRAKAIPTADILVTINITEV